MFEALNKLNSALATKGPNDITYETIQLYLKRFINSKILLYIIDYHGFTEEIKLRIIELILAAQSPKVSTEMVNCNSSFGWSQNDVCDGGYTFIHLALYGMSKNDMDNTNISYTTKFICNLIEIAKRYGFNVNAVTNNDDDNDTIAHSAIASEEYTGKIVPILKALGDEFNLYAVNNHGVQGNMNLLQAYEFYMKRAPKKSSWYIRLLSEFDEFKAYLESQKVDFSKQPTRNKTGAEHQTSSNIRTSARAATKATNPKPLIEKNTLNNIQNNLNKYKESTSIDINTFYSFVKNYQKQFTIISSKKDTNTEFLSIYQTLFGILSKIESQIKQSPSLDSIEKATDTFDALSYTPKIISPKFKSDYEGRLSTISSSLPTADTLAKLDKITEDLNTVCEKDLGTNFRTFFSEKKKRLEQKMDEIDELIKKIREAETALKKSLSKISFDRKNTTLTQAEDLIATLDKNFTGLKVEAATALSEAVNNALEPFRSLVASGVIGPDVIKKIEAALPKDITPPPTTARPGAPQRRRRKPSGQ